MAYRKHGIQKTWYTENMVHRKHGIQKTWYTENMVHRKQCIQTTWNAWHTDKMVYKQHTYSMEYTLNSIQRPYRQNEIKNVTYKKTTQKESIKNKNSMIRLK